MQGGTYLDFKERLKNIELILENIQMILEEQLRLDHGRKPVKIENTNDIIFFEEFWKDKNAK